MRFAYARFAAGATSLAVIVGGASAAPAIEFLDERLEIHGSLESQARTLNPDFDHEWDLAQWRQVLALEIETTLIDWEPVGPVDRLSTFVRLEASYDCVWTHGCELFPSANAYGDRVEKPSTEYTDARRNGFIGDDPAVNPVNAPSRYHQFPPGNLDASLRVPTDRVVGIGDTPPFEILARNQSFEAAFAPLLGYRFAVRQDHVTNSFGDSSGIDTTVLLVRPKDEVQHVATLAGVPNVSTPTLPYRPAQAPLPGGGLQPQGLFTPSAALRRLAGRDDIGSYEQNFSQRELALNFGASQQDEYVLREAYADLDLFDARLFVRAGKQTIVWGKTELFRNQDQFNPNDLAIATLPGLEESRIPQWALRAIYSFYDVGPLMDVRLEAVWMLDDFEPNDVGRCGEPFAPLPVCAKTFGIFEHGVLGVGLAGERRPPNWWEDWRGHEVGARLEWRWDRFSFALSDFLHYEDQAYPEIVNAYTRRVDPASGRPLSVDALPGASCPTGFEPGCLQPGNVGPDNAFAFTTQNRQLYDVICASSVGFFALDPSVCALTITNSLAPLGVVPANLAQLISATAAAHPTAQAIVAGLTGAPPPLVMLNEDPCDGFNDDCVALGGGAGTPAPGQGFFSLTGGGGDPTLQRVLTDQQEALVGCGPYYATSCDLLGIDLFNTEGSVLFQSWPGARPGTSVATRFGGSGSTILPGARGPGDPGWDPLIDGCVGPVSDALDPGDHCDDSNELIDPRTGQRFPSESAALSYNALLFVVALDLAEMVPGCAFPVGPNPENTPTAPLACPTVQDFFSVTAVTRPELRAGGNGRFGRRDFVWAGAGELLLKYDRVNTLGFAMDFTEDTTQTNWGFELGWTADKTFVDSESPDFTSESDLFALTVSVDRPTFIRFLNSARTFFFNMQWFFEYIPDHVGHGGDGNYRGFFVEGPFTALGTFTAQTAYFQDRLVARATGVYDVESESGGALVSLQYRYTANFSVTIGINHFYGSDRVWRLPIGLGALGESSQTFHTERLTRLNAVRERDEAFLVFRYAF